MLWEEGKIVVFKGCVWNDGWEFDAPAVVYEPIQRYGESGSISEHALYEIVEDYCIDLCCDLNPRDKFHESELKEFEWRGWSPKGFKRRKKAVHGAVTIKFCLDKYGEKSFELVKMEEVVPA